MSVYIVILIVVQIACGGFCSFIANSKNRDAGGWFLLGVIFGIFALIAIAAVPPLAKQSPVEPTPLSPEQLASRVRDQRRDSTVSRLFLIGLGATVMLIIWLIATNRI